MITNHEFQFEYVVNVVVSGVAQCQDCPAHCVSYMHLTMYVAPCDSDMLSTGSFISAGVYICVCVCCVCVYLFITN